MSLDADSFGARLGNRNRLAVSSTDFLEMVVVASFCVKPSELQGSSRGSATAAFARQVAMYLAHTCLGLSYTATGLLFGRDRTTAAYACRRIEERREDPNVDALVDCLERAIALGPTKIGKGRARQ
jgi:chromosomal replication initiation ATPase DnaA